MKNMRFRRLSLLSRHERGATSINFDEDITVVMGENDVGKSHAIKSIYAAFGADAAIVNDRWQPAQAIIALEFSVDGKIYTIVRMGTRIALFDANLAMSWCETALVREIGPRIASLLGFEIELATSQGTLVTPPPQFCFLPFYQDQDRGWNDDWASFKGLKMIPRYRQGLIEYHTGIRPKEYYVAQADKAEANRRQGDFKAERNALDRAIERLRSKRDGTGLAFRPEQFEQQISRLVEELNYMQRQYEDVRRRVGRLQSDRAVLVEQIEIAGSTLRELDADFRYIQKIDAEEVTCPTCHATYDNDFAGRFSLIGDADACRGFLVDAQKKLAEVESRLKQEQSSLRKFGDRTKDVQQILEQTRGQVKLADMLKDESERILDETVIAERAEIQASINHWLGLEHEAAETMKRFSSAERKRTIVEYYASKLAEFAHQLGVDFNEKVFKSVTPKINETGSFGTRAILAHHFAILHTIQEFTTSCLAPVVIDTPLQQDQDRDNAEAILTFIRDQKPSGMQLILGTVSLHGVEYPGAKVHPTSKFHLLDEARYEDVDDYITPFCNEMMRGDPNRLL